MNGTPVSASLVTVDYPFEFIMLQPVARLVAPGATVGGPITMRATAIMRNEASIENEDLMNRVRIFSVFLIATPRRRRAGVRHL